MRAEEAQRTKVQRERKERKRLEKDATRLSAQCVATSGLHACCWVSVMRRAPAPGLGSELRAQSVPMQELCTCTPLLTQLTGPLTLREQDRSCIVRRCPAATSFCGDCCGARA